MRAGPHLQKASSKEKQFYDMPREASLQEAVGTSKYHLKFADNTAFTGKSNPGWTNPHPKKCLKELLSKGKVIFR
jgi:hypothetical protein